LNYRHAFHAGNFADVLKHVVLVALIESLIRKDKPLAYLETHAGAGLYDLGGAASRTGEFRDGIGRMWDTTGAPGPLGRYLDLVHSIGGKVAAPARYPGSPWLAANMLRPGDRLRLAELAYEPARELATLFKSDRRVQVESRDGYAALKAWLPPPERRALVLIDPPYESQLDEFRTIKRALEEALRRFPTGVHAIWYPIKRRPDLNPFLRWAAGSEHRHVLRVELMVWPDNAPLRLNGCGMMVLNAPFDLDRALKPALQVMVERMARDPRAAGTIDWLARD
jgi:23S rRNA (adenine2030-N6)-methyltransferase